MRSILKTAPLSLLFAFLFSPANATGYDPLPVVKAAPERKDFTVKDEKRSREIPIRVYLPQEKQPAAVVLFSHGLGGTRAGCAYLGDHWALRGYVAVFLQHPGSDDGVWKDLPPDKRLAAMQKAANLSNFMLRVRDVPAVLDQLAVWNKIDSHPLAGRMDLKRIGMSGHSFGAVTAQAVSGQSFPLGRNFTEPRIKAAVAMSPSGPRGAGDPKKAFGDVQIPWMLLTGTRDVALIGNISAESRLAVFPALTPGGKYELVLDKAEHSAFADRELPGETQKHNPNHHRVILAATTAFWDAHLRDDPEAKKWLDGESMRGLLESGDRWQKK
ncbi:MAG: dienelactone hydrolase [Pirellulales bacterium]|nr:dienelactone hydrolase [Pirellulales bacterium]